MAGWAEVCRQGGPGWNLAGHGWTERPWFGSGAAEPEPALRCVAMQAHTAACAARTCTCVCCSPITVPTFTYICHPELPTQLWHVLDCCSAPTAVAWNARYVQQGFLKRTLTGQEGVAGGCAGTAAPVAAASTGTAAGAAGRATRWRSWQCCRRGARECLQCAFCNGCRQTASAKGMQLAIGSNVKPTCSFAGERPLLPLADAAR